MSKTHKALLQVCEYEIKLDLELSTAATIKSWVYTQDESARKAVDGGNQNNFAKTDCLLCRNGHFKKCQVVWRLENVEDLNFSCHIQAVVQTLIHSTFYSAPLIFAVLRNLVWEIWFEKSGSRILVDQKKRWFYTIDLAFFQVGEKWLTRKKIWVWRTTFLHFSRIVVAE